MNKEIIALTALVAIIISIIGSGSLITIAKGQSQHLTNNSTTGSAKKPLPVLLLHGYASDVSEWKKWHSILSNNFLQIR